MKTTILNIKTILFLALLTWGAQRNATGAPSTCGLSFTGPAGNVLTSYIVAYPNYPNSDATFNVIVQDSTEPLPEGTYLSWCVDANAPLDPTQGNTVAGTIYTGLLFPTCDTNLNSQLPQNHAASVYVSPAVWQEVNYILNHTNGAYFWDIQVAILDLVGGPPPPSPPYPPFDTNVVASLLSAASNNAAAWTPTCGDVIGAIYDIEDQGNMVETNQVQLVLIEVPYCPITFTSCPPDLTLGCNPPAASIPSCQGPGDPTNVAAVSCCGYPVTITCTQSDSTAGCESFRYLIYTASDGYGNTASCMQTIAWTTDTNAPVIIASPTNSNLGCNPATLPTDASVKALVAATDNCSVESTNVSHVDSGSPCEMTRTFMITATDGCGNISAPKTVIYNWTIDTNAPVIVSAPTNSNLGCNPPALPTDASIKAQVVASDNCSLQSTNVSHVDSGSPCGMMRTFSITATDGCGNTSATKNVIYTWTIDTNAPVIISAPTNSNLGCNPPALPTDASIKAQVVASDNCSLQSTNVSHVDSGSPCGMMRTFSITATDGCGNTSATKNVIYTWTIDTNAPIIVSVPGSTNLGCNPVTLPTDANIRALVVAADNCSLQSTNVSHLDVTNGCIVSRTFTINVTDGCGNVSTNAVVVYTWTADTTAPTVICPPNITISNSVVPYCTFMPCDYGAICNGTNASSILTNCFKKIYTNGFAWCGLTNSGYCLKFTTCTNAQKFVGCGGTPGCLKTSYTNPNSCEAGVFAGQVLCLKFNVDFGDNPAQSGFPAACGNLVLNDSTCPLNGQSIRQILSLCHTALGGSNISSSGCTISNLSVICSNLNQAFECGTPSSWCNGHLIPPTITNVPPSLTGYATVIDKCTSTPSLTYTDSITAGTCSGTYVIARTWVAVDECGNSNYCTQNIYVGNSAASVCGSVFLDCNGDGFLTPGIDMGLTNVVVTLKNAQGAAIATNTTDENGAYCFYNLTPGTYTVLVTPPSGYSQTAGTHTNHWLNTNGQQCWNENDGNQHCKGGDGVDRWVAGDGYQHWKNSNGQDCWTDKYGNSHTQNCTYVSCDLPAGNAETFTLAPCEYLTCVNFAYVGTAPKVVCCVTGPNTGYCGQSATYSCCVTNTGTTCFTACQVTACGKSYSCPPLSPGQGCSISCNYQYQWNDFGAFNCQASASCNYPTSNNSCTAQGSCSTFVYW